MAPEISDLFELPLSQLAFQELRTMHGELVQLQLKSGENDQWRTIWKDGVFTSHLYYLHCFKDSIASPIFNWIWSSRVLLRIKVFAWLLVSDRLNTRDMLRRRNWNVTSDLDCVLCPTHSTEDWIHLFFDCNFSHRIWIYLQIEWEPADTLEEIFISARRKFNKPFFHGGGALGCMAYLEATQ